MLFSILIPVLLHILVLDLGEHVFWEPRVRYLKNCSSQKSNVMQRYLGVCCTIGWVSIVNSMIIEDCISTNYSTNKSS